MFTTLFTVALFVLLAIQGVLADFNMDIPSLTQCQDSHLAWDKTHGPYSVLVVPPEDVCGDPIIDLGDHTQNHMTFHKVPLVGGTKVVLSVIDANGDEAYSPTVLVGHSTDVSCLPKDKQASASAANAAATPTGTTLVAPPPSASTSAVAAGAANAGLVPSSASRQISVPALTISALIGAVALLL